MPEAAIRRGLGIVVVAVGTVFLGLGLSSAPNDFSHKGHHDIGTPIVRVAHETVDLKVLAAGSWRGQIRGWPAQCA
jgi:hypothetical protein